MSLGEKVVSIAAQPNHTFRYVLRDLNRGRVLIHALEKESEKRLLVNDKKTVSLMTNSSISRYWPVYITEGKILCCQVAKTNAC